MFAATAAAIRCSVLLRCAAFLHLLYSLRLRNLVPNLLILIQVLVWVRVLVLVLVPNLVQILVQVLVWV